jgi:membrane-associated phospholipid phosphatase
MAARSTDRARHPRALRSAALGGAATLAAAGAVAWHGASLDEPLDERVRTWLRRRHHPVVQGVSQTVALLGSIPVVLGAAAVGAAVVGRRRGRGVALPLLVCVGSAIGAQTAIKELVCRERPPRPRRRPARTSSFPSGHTTRASAAAAVSGYVALREGLVPRRVALPLAIGVPAAVGASRVYGDRHWATDVAGGWGLGALVAALCALWYDRARAAQGR